MRFISGIVVGVTAAAAAAAWYLSRSGERFREEYRVEERLGEIGDQMDARAREIQAAVASQVSSIQAQMADGSGTEDALADGGPAADAANDITDPVATGVAEASEPADEV